MDGDKTENDKKRHHYVPVTYLDKFCDDDGRIFAYRKDDPLKALHLKPDAIAYERYYYSQPLPNDSRDNNTLENFFSTIETRWPAVVERIGSASTDVSDFASIIEFVTLMRVRVPAAREMAETNLAHMVLATAKAMDRSGQLPPKPEGFENILDQTTVSIDPHMSIHAMPAFARGFGRVVDHLGFGIVHNKTPLTFITSDNPVAYYDPSASEISVEPYRVNPFRGRVELLFPIDPLTLLVGRTEWRSGFSPGAIRHYELRDTKEVKRINRYVSRFGYRFVFSRDSSHAALVAKYSAKSPISVVHQGSAPEDGSLHFQCVFGERPKLPKWERPANQKFYDADNR